MRTSSRRHGRYWPMFFWPAAILALGVVTRFALLPRLDQLASGPPPLDVMEQTEIPPEERHAGQPEELVGVLGVLPGRHWGLVACAAVSPDGKRLATGGDDMRVCLWDTADMKTVDILPDFNDKIHLVAFSPDNKHLAVANGPELSLWNIEGKPVKAAALPTNTPVHTISFSGTGKRLAVATADAIVHLWELENGQLTQRFTHAFNKPDVEDKQVLRSLALAADGQALAVCLGGTGDIVTLYDVGTNGLREALQVKAIGPTFALHFAGDLKTILAMNEEGRVKVWAPFRGKPRGDLEDSGPWLGASADSKTLATCTVGGTLRLWDNPSDGEVKLRSFLPLKHGAPLEWVAFAPDMKSVVTGGGNAVRFWDISGAVPLLRGTLQSPKRSALALAFAPDGKTLAAGGWFPRPGSETGEDGGIQFWDLTGKQPRERVRVGGHKKEVTYLAVAPNGRALASGGDDGVRLWDLTGQVKERAMLQSVTGPLVFSANSKQLATATGGLIQLWSPGGDELARWAKFPDAKAPASRITSLAFAPDGGTLAAATKQRTVDLWALGGSLPGERVTLEGAQIGHTIAFTQDGRGLLTAGLDWGVRLFDLSGTTPRLKFGPEAVANSTGADPLIVFAPNGRLAAQALADGIVLVWNPSTGKRHFQWKFPGDVKALAFAPDGRHLATANTNGTVYILRLGRPAAPARPQGTPPEQ